MSWHPKLYTNDGERRGPWTFQKPSEGQMRDRTQEVLRDFENELFRMERDLRDLERLQAAYLDQIRLDVPVSELRAKHDALKGRRDRLQSRERAFAVHLGARVKGRWEKHWGEPWRRT